MAGSDSYFSPVVIVVDHGRPHHEIRLVLGMHQRNRRWSLGFGRLACNRTRQGEPDKD
jgi:hypothetical protein